MIKIKTVVVTCFALLIVFAPLLALAQANPCSLSDTGDKASQLPRCVNQVYIWSLGVGALLALLMTVIGGYYKMTAAGNAEQSAKGTEYIWGSIIGLTILFTAYLLLRTINPDLVNFNLNSLNGLNTTPAKNTPQKSSLTAISSPNETEIGWHYNGSDIVFEWQYYWVRDEQGNWAIFSAGQTKLGDGLLIITGTPEGQTSYKVYPGILQAKTSDLDVVFSSRDSSFKSYLANGTNVVEILTPDFKFNGRFLQYSNTLKHGTIPITQGLVSPNYYSSPLRVVGSMNINGKDIQLDGAVAENDHQYGMLTGTGTPSFKFSNLAPTGTLPISHDWIYSELSNPNGGGLKLVITKIESTDSITNYIIVDDGSASLTSSDLNLQVIERFPNGFSKKVRVISGELDLDMVVEVPRSDSVVIMNSLQEDGGAIISGTYRGENYSGKAIKESTSKK